MNKTFIFDMDGVMVNSEPVWEYYEKQFLPQIMGNNIYGKVKTQILGNSRSKIYDIATSYGMVCDKEKFVKIYDDFAPIVYKKSALTPLLEVAIENLINKGFQLGLVSVSNQKWINIVLNKLKKKKVFKYILSLDSPNILPKPFPDGYIKAMNVLNVKPNTTIILEDSNLGIQAAKASGAFTICLRENLPQNYVPSGADLYIKSIKELINKIEETKI